MKVTYDKLKDTIKNALTASGVSEEKSEIMAKVHADSTLKGVNSHGLNRIPRLINFIDKGLVILALSSLFCCLISSSTSRRILICSFIIFCVLVSY